MKKTIILTWVALALCASCNNDIPMTEEEAQTGKIKVTALGSMSDNVSTRISYEDQETSGGGRQLAITWDPNGERIGITNGTTGTMSVLQQVPMSIAGTSAAFTGEIDGATEGQKFYAFYPSDLGNTLNPATPTQLHLDMSTMKGTGDFAVVMYAEAPYESGSFNFPFKYATSVLRIIPTFVASEAPYITSKTYYNQCQTTFNLMAESGLYSSADLDLSTGLVSNQNGTRTLDLYSINAEYSETDDNNITFPYSYLSLLPGTVTDFCLKFRLLDGFYEGKIVSSYDFKAGNFYYTKVNMKKTGVIIAKTESGSGSDSRILLSEVLSRITTRDTSIAMRKSVMFGQGSGAADFPKAELQQSDEYASGLATKSSILGNWLRTVATGVEDFSLEGTLYLYDLPDYAFYGCNHLTSFTINDYVKTIGEYALADMGVETMVITASVKQLKDYSLRGVKNLVLLKGDTDEHNYYSYPLIPALKWSTNESDHTACCMGDGAEVAQTTVFLPFCQSAEMAQDVQDKLQVISGGKKYAPAVYYNTSWNPNDDYSTLYNEVSQAIDTSKYTGTAIPAIDGVSAE